MPHPIPGYLQGQVGSSLEQFGLVERSLPIVGVWNQVIFGVPSIQNHSMILYYTMTHFLHSFSNILIYSSIKNHLSTEYGPLSKGSILEQHSYPCVCSMGRRSCKVLQLRLSVCHIFLQGTPPPPTWGSLWAAGGSLVQCGPPWAYRGTACFTVGYQGIS